MPQQLGQVVERVVARELVRVDQTHDGAAEAVGDYAGFFQAVWQPHFIITAYAFGGFRSQNSDAEWLDMRQSLFDEAFTRPGLLTARQDLLSGKNDGFI